MMVLFPTMVLLHHANVLPVLLDEAVPLHEAVKVDYYLPGCPPSGDAIWAFLTQLIEGKDPSLGHGLLHYD